MESVCNIFSCGYLNHDTYSKNIILPIVFGALTSVWSNAIFMSTLDHHIDKFIFIAIQHTHYITIAAATFSLVHGLTKKKRHFLLPWLNCKGFECVMCLIYFILFFNRFFDGNILHFRSFGLIGLGTIIANLYLVWYIWKRFKTTPDLPTRYNEIFPPENVMKVDLPQKFEECANQTSNV